jgi:hypothetical protein
MNKKQFLTLVLPWLLVVLLASLLIVISFTPKPEVTVLPLDNRIDSLHNIVDSLDQRIIELRHDYDSVQQNIKDSIRMLRYIAVMTMQNIIV